MKSKSLIELVMASDHKSVNGRQDQEIVVGLEISPAKSLRNVAHQRSAQPHIAYALDVSGSMTVVTDPSDALIVIGSEERDGHLYNIVRRQDGTEPNTLLDDVFQSASMSLRELKANDQVTIFHFSTEVSAGETFGGSQQKELQAAIERGHEVKHAATNMTAVIDQILTHLREEKDRPRLMVLFSDGMPDRGTELKVLAAAKRCAEQGIPIHICAFGDELSLDFLGEISSSTGGTVTIGRDRDEVLRQFRNVLRDAQETALVDLELTLDLDPQFLVEEIFRGKPQSQLLKRIKPGTDKVTLQLGNLNAGSWQSLYIKGRLLGRGETSGIQPLVQASLSYRSPKGNERHRVQSTYQVELADRSRIDRHMQELMEITLLKSKEKDFQDYVQQHKWKEAQAIAVLLIRAYEQLSSSEGAQNAENFKAIVLSLSTGGAIDYNEIQRLANTASDSSTTAAQSERFRDSSSTNIFRSGSESQTRDYTGDYPNQRPNGRKVLQFDI